MGNIDWNVTFCNDTRKAGECRGTIKEASCRFCGVSENLQVVCSTWTMGPRYGDTGDTEMCSPYCICIDTEACKTRSKKLRQAQNMQELGRWRANLIKRNRPVYEVIHSCGKVAFYSDTDQLPIGYNWITFFGPHCIACDGSQIAYDEYPVCASCHTKIAVTHDLKLEARQEE